MSNCVEFSTKVDQVIQECMVLTVFRGIADRSDISAYEKFSLSPHDGFGKDSCFNATIWSVN